MGWEYEPETVWKAQELYCVDRLSFARVAELTGVSATTLKAWSEKYGWRAKREGPGANHHGHGSGRKKMP